MATIAKLLPYELWEIDAVEGWLDDMASQGLIFTHNSGGQFYFRQDDPQTLRHRLDFHEKHAGDDARCEAFRDFGWEHLCYIDARTDIYRAIREDAVELNTDEETLRSVMERSQRRLRRTMHICWGLSAAMLIFAAISLCRFGISHIFLTKNIFRLLQLPLWGALILFGDIRLWRSYREMQHRSLLERSYHTREREASRRREQRTDTILRVVLLVLIAIPLFVDDYDLRESMEIVDTGHERYSLQEVLPEDFTDANSYAMYYPHALSEEYYFPQKTASGKRYYANVYEVRWEWLARAYAREQAHIADAEALEVANHDAAWFYRGTPISQRHYADTPDTQNLILLQGNIVVEIEYTGPADLRAAAEVIG